MISINLISRKQPASYNEIVIIVNGSQYNKIALYVDPEAILLFINGMVSVVKLKHSPFWVDVLQYVFSICDIVYKRQNFLKIIVHVIIIDQCNQTAR